MKKGKDYIGMGVGAWIFSEKNEVLLLRRNKGAEIGKWSIPGGSVEFFETMEDAIIREVKEEVDLDIEITKQLGAVNHIIEEEGAHWVAVEFLCNIVGGVAKNLEPLKHSDMKWFLLDDLPEDVTITVKEGLKYIKELEL